MGANARTTRRGLEKTKEELTKTKNAKDESFSYNLLTHATFHSAENIP